MYCGKEWDTSAVLYSPDTTKCPVCDSSGEFYIKVRKKPKSGNVFGYDEKAQEAQDYGRLFDAFNED
jgi:hypothetical protein